MRLWVSVPLMALLATAQTGAAQEADHDDHDADAGQMTIETAPQQAELALDCAFRVECVEDEPCAAAGFDAALTGHAGGLTAQSMVAEVKMITINGTQDLLGVREGTALSLSGGTFEARHLLSVTETGAARYTLHYIDGPLMVSYLGRCEEK